MCRLPDQIAVPRGVNVCVRERYRETRNESLAREHRFKDRTLPVSSGSASWRFLAGRCWKPYNLRFIGHVADC